MSYDFPKAHSYWESWEDYVESLGFSYYAYINIVNSLGANLGYPRGSEETQERQGQKEMVKGRSRNMSLL